MTDDDSFIGDNEIICRRIPVSRDWCDGTDVFPEAFEPHKKDDTTGISLSRLDFKTIDEIAEGRSSRGYYVAKLMVGDVRRIGLTVEFRPNIPQGYDKSHVEIPELNVTTRKSDDALEAQESLASIVMEVLGPFLQSDT